MIDPMTCISVTRVKRHRRNRLLTSGLRMAARSYCLSAASFRLACLHSGRNTAGSKVNGHVLKKKRKKKLNGFATLSRKTLRNWFLYLGEVESFVLVIYFQQGPRIGYLKTRC